MNNYSIKVPAELLDGDYSLINLIKEFTKNENEIKNLINNKDRIYYFISKLNYKMQRDNTIIKQLNAEYIRSFFPFHTNLINKFLLWDERILIKVKNYKVGCYSSTYRLFTRYNYMQPSIYLFYSHEDYLKIQKKKNSNTYLSKHIIKCMNELVLDTDISDLDLLNLNYKQHEHIVKYYNDFVNKNWSISETKFERGGRLFCTVNQMNNEFLRKKLKHNSNNEICEIDMKNAQPWFLSQLLKENYIIDEYNDLYFFIKYVENGTIYQEFEKVYGYTNGVANKNKKQIKKILYYSIFKEYEPSEIEKKEVKKLFTNFPLTLELINKLKIKYENLAIKLQQMESDFFIKVLSKELYKMKKFFIPIHDSVMCFVKDKEIIMKIINEYFINEYKIIPNFHI